MNDAGFYNTSANARWLPLGLMIFLCFFTLPSYAGLVFNELMIGSSHSGEWMELFNPDTSAMALSGVRLYEGTDTVELDPTKKQSVPARGYLLVVQDSAKIRAAYPYIGCRLLDPASWLTLNNDGDTLGLCDSVGTTLDLVGYDPQAWLGRSIPDGISLERRDPSIAPDLASTWALCRNPNGATPGFTNSVLAAAGRSLELRAGPKLFRPESNEQLHITLELPGAGDLMLEVFSFEGRSVHAIRAGPATDRLALSWDGRHNGRTLKPGPYILLAEWKAGSRKETRKQSIVIAPRK